MNKSMHVRGTSYQRINLRNNTICLLYFVIFVSNYVTSYVTYLSCDTNENISNKTFQAVDSLIYCGPKTFLHLYIELESTSVPQAKNYDWKTLNYPIALNSSDTCQFQIPTSGKVQNVLVSTLANELAEYNENKKKWIIQMTVSFPKDLLDVDFDEKNLFKCTLSKDPMEFIIDTSVPEFHYLSSNYTIQDILLKQNSKPIGVDKTASLYLHTKNKNRDKTLNGECYFKEEKVNVVEGSLNYTVQENDSDTTAPGVPYRCDVIDGALNSLSQDGFMLHEPTKSNIDGVFPVIKDDIIVFSTDQPAHIGSVISFTLEAVDHSSLEYTGTCKLGHIKHRHFPLVAAVDTGFYMAQYTVSDGDPDILSNTSTSLACEVSSPGGNTILVTENVTMQFGIDANAPIIDQTSILFVSSEPAQVGTIIEIQMATKADESGLHIYDPPGHSSCMVNNVSVAASFSESTPHAFLLTYVLGEEDPMWKVGELPIYCQLQDAAGNRVVVDAFTDNNQLFSRVFKPESLDPDDILSSEYLPNVNLILIVFLVVVASHSIAKFGPIVGLPQITGYLLTGILAGPFVLNLVQEDELHHLRIVDEIALAYIGLSAGSKLHWKDMRPLIKSISILTFALTLVEFIVGTLTIWCLAEFLPFLQDATYSEKCAIAMLAGVMMIARSPSSALAVIEELRASGHFTNLILAVTIACDVVVIFLYNVNSMITETILADKKQHVLTAIMGLGLQLGTSFAAGLIFGILLSLLFSRRFSLKKRKSVWTSLVQLIKQSLLLLYGWSIFILGHIAHPYIEPILCCMVSGAILSNISNSHEELEMVMSNLAPIVYVTFFTITGISLELDLMTHAMVIGSILCVTRILAIIVGSYAGGYFAKENREQRKVMWMAYITQAGVTLGLAKQTQLLYPSWGTSFATMIIAVVIFNQLIGPPFLKYVLRLVGEARASNSRKSEGKVDGLVALVLHTHNSTKPVVGSNSTAFRLRTCGWESVVYSLHNISKVEKSATINEETALQENLRLEVFHIIKTVGLPLDAVIVMMDTNEDNHQAILAIARAWHDLQRLKVLRIVVQLASTSIRSPSTAENDEDDSDERDYLMTKFMNLPTTLNDTGDAIDVVVVDKVDATNMLLELAASGKVVNTAKLIAQTQAPKSIKKNTNSNIITSIFKKHQENMQDQDTTDLSASIDSAELTNSVTRRKRTKSRSFMTLV